MFLKVSLSPNDVGLDAVKTENKGNSAFDESEVSDNSLSSEIAETNFSSVSKIVQKMVLLSKNANGLNFFLI